MRKTTVALLGGPAAGQVVKTDYPKIAVPVWGVDGIGFVTYHVRRVRIGRLVWFVAQPEGVTDPVHPFQRRTPKPYVFGA